MGHAHTVMRTLGAGTASRRKTERCTSVPLTLPFFKSVRLGLSPPPGLMDLREFRISSFLVFF